MYLINIKYLVYICVLITLLQLYYKANYQKIKHNSKFASSFCRFQLQEWGLSLAYLNEMMLI